MLVKTDLASLGKLQSTTTTTTTQIKPSGKTMALDFVSSKYRVLGKKGEGTFSEVLKCQNVKDGTYFACKKMKQQYESVEQINNLREIQAMRRLSSHPNILQLHEVMFDRKVGTLVLIVELMDMNIYEMIRGRRHYVPEKKVKLLMYQLLRSIDHMHRNGIFHRDVKPENILVREDLLKLADFGSCRSVYSKQPYTEYISTRWYRAPECLLTDGYYTYKMDIWSVGCVFFEIMSLHPLFPGSNEVDQIAKIHDVMGTPDPSVLNRLRNKTRGMNFNFPSKKGSGIERMLPHASSECISLIYEMCAYDPDQRISAKQALKHHYFKELRDAEKRAAALAKQQKLEAERNSTTEQLSGRETGESTTATDQKSEKSSSIISPTLEVRRKGQAGVQGHSKVTSPRPGSGSHRDHKVNASILHNRDPVYNYHRKEKRRRKQLRGMRLAESGPPGGSTGVTGAGLLPKVPQANKPSSYQSTFKHTNNNPLPSNKYPHHSNPAGQGAGSSLPQISTKHSTSSTGNHANHTNTYLTGLAHQAWSSGQHKTAKPAHATKNSYGHYQLPSIGDK